MTKKELFPDVLFWIGWDRLEMHDAEPNFTTSTGSFASLYCSKISTRNIYIIQTTYLLVRNMVKCPTKQPAAKKVDKTYILAALFFYIFKEVFENEVWSSKSQAFKRV